MFLIEAYPEKSAIRDPSRPNYAPAVVQTQVPRRASLDNHKYGSAFLTLIVPGNELLSFSSHVSRADVTRGSCRYDSNSHESTIADEARVAFGRLKISTLDIRDPALQCKL